MISQILTDWFADLDTWHRALLCATAYLGTMCPVTFCPDFDQTNRDDNVQW
jgi:hypothetical protein